MANHRNTEKTTWGIEIYTSEIFRIVDEYIETELDGDDSVFDKTPRKFRAMLLYIRARIPRPDFAEIELLDKLFFVYTSLCFKYGINPTLQSFGFMVGISSDVFNDWINGNTRSKLYFTEEGEPIEGSSVYI